MHDWKSDWKRWSCPERISAVAIVAAAFIVCGSPIVGVLTGGRPVFLLAATPIERSGTHESHVMRQ
jgi:hypothetical protein